MKKRILLPVVSILMIPAAVLMALFLTTQVNSIAVQTHLPGQAYAGYGTVAAILLYLCSVVTAVLGLIFVGKRSARVCRIAGWVQLGVSLALILPLLAYAALFLAPMWLETVLYLIGARKKLDRTVPEDGQREKEGIA